MFKLIGKLLGKLSAVIKEKDFGVWFESHNFTIAFIEGMDCKDGAYVTIYDRKDRAKAHNVVLGIRNNNEPFIQACTPNKAVSANLIEMIEFFNSQKEKIND